MNLVIQLPHAPEDAALHEHAERSLRFALTRFSSAVADIRLRLVDENGPRGGADQRCRVQIVLRQGGGLSVEGVDADPRVAIDQVAARAARTVARRLSRARAASPRAKRESPMTPLTR